MATAARGHAFRILLVLERKGPTLSDLLAEGQVEALPRRDRAFLHELLLGTLRRRGALDHVLAPLLSRPLDRLDPGTLAALRLGANQILHMRVPHRAAVMESVELARAAAPRSAGLVNAVLRRLAREGPPAPPDPATDPRGWLAAIGSLPAWLAERWLERLGPEAAVARARAFLERPPTVVRLNPRAPDARARLDAAGLEPTPAAVPGAWQIAGAGTLTDLASEAVIHVQDQGSQLVAHLAASPGLVLDACAAPGGKSMLIADLAGPSGRVVAAEVSPRRLRVLGALVRRWGAPNVAVVGADARRPPFRGAFDSVLLDAPCSGLGTLGRNPDIKWRLTRADLSRADVRRHARRQRELLFSVAGLVKPGGRLVYSVCSTEREEGEDVVEEFLQDQSYFQPAPLPDWTLPFAHGRFLRTLPERHGGDGFFVAALQRGQGAGRDRPDRPL
jgi:16S rRNA (cytosine967-C5)-methyltransferase